MMHSKLREDRNQSIHSNINISLFKYLAAIIIYFLQAYETKTREKKHFRPAH